MHDDSSYSKPSPLGRGQGEGVSLSSSEPQSTLTPTREERGSDWMDTQACQRYHLRNLRSDHRLLDRIDTEGEEESGDA
jgi:hypothetical protein